MDWALVCIRDLVFFISLNFFFTSFSKFTFIVATLFYSTLVIKMIIKIILFLRSQFMNAGK
jgi:hypothetical protein